MDKVYLVYFDFGEYDVSVIGIATTLDKALALAAEETSLVNKYLYIDEHTLDQVDRIGKQVYSGEENSGNER